MNFDVWWNEKKPDPYIYIYYVTESNGQKPKVYKFGEIYIFCKYVMVTMTKLA